MATEAFWQTSIILFSLMENRRPRKRLKVHVQFSMPTSKCWKYHVRTGIVHVCWASPFIKYIELVPSSKQGRLYTGAHQISCMILLSIHTSRIPCSIVRHSSYTQASRVLCLTCKAQQRCLERCCVVVLRAR